MDKTKLSRKSILLQGKRENLFRRIQILYDLSQDLSSEAKIKEFVARFATIGEIKDKFESVLDEWNEINIELDEKATANYQEIVAFEDLYFKIKAIGSDIVARRDREASQNLNGTGSEMEARPRLPKIDLVEFDGDPLKWPFFHETFKSLVHNNAKLDPISKMHYLLGKLKGKALSLSAGLLPSAENYSVLYQALIDRFEDKRALASLYLEQILNFKPFVEGSIREYDNFSDKIDAAMFSLLKLNIEDLGQFVLTTICSKILNTEARILYERSVSGKDFPKYESLSNFVKEQSRILSRSLGKNRGSQAKSYKVHSLVVSEGGRVVVQDQRCIVCKSSSHFIDKCDHFLKLTSGERSKFGIHNSLCFNCLKTGHRLRDCSSPVRCKRCNKKHHTLLHEGMEEKEKVPKSTEKCSTVSLVSTNTNKRAATYTVVLATAVVLARSPKNENVRMRVLLDSASQCNFITKEFCQKLGLRVSPSETSVAGIGSIMKRVSGQTNVQFVSRFSKDKEFKMDALVIDQITDYLPSRCVDEHIVKQLQKYSLADDKFGIPGPIDGMIGAELLPELLGSQRVGKPGIPPLIESPLGFVVMGRLLAKAVREKRSYNQCQVYCCMEANCMSNLMSRFWELENIPESKTTSPDDACCERLYTSQVSRDLAGRFTVGLPFISYPPKLGDSYTTALKRFLSLEKRFETDSLFKENYKAVMLDYLNQGHMKPSDRLDKRSGYFIPHHGVVKLSSSSTPLRVVFDASAKTSNGQSLNDVLYTGEKLQNDIFEILLRFRLFKVAMTADVRQMYRQINMLPEHQPYQRLLWRFSPNEPISSFELTTVTFGLKPSPFLALRTLQQLAKEENTKFPLAVIRLQKEIYMDDVVSSVEEESEAVELYRQWVGLLKAGGFDLVKWASNSVRLLREIPATSRREDAVEFPTDFLKILGLQWNAKEDSLLFKVKIKEGIPTKRGVLSTIARIWDPLGLLAPVTIWAKILMKELWELKLGWDDTLPPEIQTRWQDFQRDLALLDLFRIPRHVGIHRGKRSVLFGFADASEKAFAAVLYLWVENKDGIGEASLLCAKSKVTPQKTISIPRLELCASLLLARLIDAVLRTYEKVWSLDKILAFTDSTVALHWIKGSPNRWKTFVATRVTKIQQIVPAENWFHVKTENNPADCASRGLSPKELLENSRWRTGPAWLSRKQDWPLSTIDICEEEAMKIEKKPQCLVTMFEEHPFRTMIDRCGSWTKLVRVTGFILRFLKRIPRRNHFSLADLEKAEFLLFKIIQRLHFGTVLESLKCGKQIPKSLRVLRPFLNQNIIRVGGRLGNAPLSYDQQHPILLPAKEPACRLLVDHLHRKNLHAGPTLLLAILRQRFWIMGARNLVRQRYQQCNRCFRCKPKVTSPIMGDLPFPRVAEVKPFAHTGVDFGGPFRLTLSKHRGVKTQKAYLCLFVCMATRAIHLECASDLSTEAFLAALKRFLARRGPCSIVYSDQGTNFVGAKNYLDSLPQFLASKKFQADWKEELIGRRIEWKFNPPAAPHFGGLWEAGIKSVKVHLTRVIGEQVLNYEEFYTLLCQVEALLNSRPLSELSADPAEPAALTPAHFLNLTPLQSLPIRDLEEVPYNGLHRWRVIDQMVKSYWKRWRQEYLSSLQTRQKWNTPAHPIKPGTVVVIHYDNVPPLKWPLGVVEEVYPGKDQVARVALVRTKNSSLQRPITKLSPLPTQ